MFFLDISFLHSRLRTCTLRKDFEGQAVLINCLLRNYLFYSLYDQVSHYLIFLYRKTCLTKDFFQADKLVSKSVFPESGSNNEWSRYLYYLGRIKAIQLEYSQVETFEDENSKVIHLKLIFKIYLGPYSSFASYSQSTSTHSSRLQTDCSKTVGYSRVVDGRHPWTAHLPSVNNATRFGSILSNDASCSIGWHTQIQSSVGKLRQNFPGWLLLVQTGTKIIKLLMIFKSYLGWSYLHSHNPSTS